MEKLLDLLHRQVLRRTSLLEVNILSYLEEFKKFNKDYPHKEATLLFLETLILISLALYRKSELLIETYFPKREAQLEEEFLKVYLPVNTHEALSLALPLHRLLNEKVFVPRVNGLLPRIEREPISILIEAMLNHLQQTYKAKPLVLDLPERGLSFYLAEVEAILRTKGRMLLSELAEGFSSTPLTLVYLFLVLLFLSFEGKARIFQRDDDLEILCGSV